MVKAAVVESIQRYLTVLNEQGMPALFCVVYGSQANGSSHEWSDIDLLVVSPRYDGVHSREEWANLWYIASSIDPCIEPIPCGEIEWFEDDSNPIIAIARKEGIVIEVGEPISSSVVTKVPKNTGSPRPQNPMRPDGA